MVTHPALHRHRLNLGDRLHGYREVLLREPVAPARAAFDHRIAEGAYLIFIFAKDARGFAGVRLSRNAAYPDLLFTATPEGAFLSRAALAVPEAAKPAGRLAVAFDAEDCAVFAGGVRIARCGFAASGPQRIGFRGGNDAASVDNVEILDRAGAVALRADFRNRRGAGRARLLAFAAVAAAALAAYCLAPAGRARRFAPPAATPGLAAAASLWLLVDYWALSDRLPRKIDFGPYKTTIERPREIAARLARLGPPPPGARRVLFLGGSQTWGAGASRAEEAIPAAAERAARALPGGENVECVNAGVSGADAGAPLAFYARDLRRLRPEVMVLNLGQNDKDPEALARAVEGLLALNEEDGVRTPVILEPRSLENPRLRLPGNHAALRRVAAARGVPALDLHGRLAGEDARDRGLLWWDAGHLTGYGQRLFAEEIAPHIVRALGAGPALTSAASADRRPGGSSRR